MRQLFSSIPGQVLDFIVVLVSLVIVFKKQINKLSSVHKYSEINFHLILFPVPDKTKIVNWFISQAKNLKNDADE